MSPEVLCETDSSRAISGADRLVGDHGTRIVLGKPQHRGCDPHLPAITVLVIESGKSLLSPLNLAETLQGLQQEEPHRCGRQVRRGQQPGQLRTGPESGQRRGVLAVRQSQQPAQVVDRQPYSGRASALRARPARWDQNSASSSLPCQAEMVPSATPTMPTAGVSVQPCRVASSIAWRPCSVATANDWKTSADA
jgi:hypothetical protein